MWSREPRFIQASPRLSTSARSGRWSSALALLALVLAAGRAQVATDPATARAAVPKSSAFAETSSARQWRAARRAAHQTEWHSIRFVTNRLTGAVRARTNVVVQLADGLNRLDAATGAWRAASPAFRITDQGAVADRGALHVTLSPNINVAGAVTVRKGTVKFSAHPLGVAYHDPVDGQTYLLGTLTDAAGWVVGDGSEVVYSNCFKGLRASIRYRNSLNGLEQDLLLHEQPPVSPADLGLSTRTRLELISELVGETPAPELSSQVVEREPDPVLRSALVEPDFIDQTLRFGALKMGRGKAFLHTPSGDPRLGGDALEAPREVPVGKRLVTFEGRRLVIEAVEHRRIQPHLRRLPAANERGVTNAALVPPRSADGALLAALAVTWDSGTRGSPTSGVQFRDLPRIPEAPGPATIRMQMAAGARPASAGDEAEMASATVRPGAGGNASAGTAVAVVGGAAPALVIDWHLVGSPGDSLENYEFHGTNTYVVANEVSLTGATKFHGGTVIKFAPYGSGAAINILGTVTCEASDLSPIILTGRDDDLLGEVAPGSTGTVTTFGYGSDYLRIVGSSPAVLQHLRILHSGGYGINLVNGSASNELWHSQIVHSAGIWAENSSITVRNVLLHDVTGLIEGINFGVDIQQVTAHTVWWGFADDGGWNPGPFTMVNSLLSQVPFKAGYTVPPSVVWSATEIPNLFETVGAGGHYLKAGTHQNSSVAAPIDPALAADLARRTTQAPEVLAGSIHEPQVLPPRGLGDTPPFDLGFHYPIADYAANAVIENTTVVLTNGVVVLAYGAQAFRLNGGAQLISEGHPVRMNHIVPYLHAQEQTESWGPYYRFGHTFFTYPDDGSTLPDPAVRLRWTRLDRRLDGGEGYHVYVFGDCRAAEIVMRDSDVKGGSIIGWGETAYTVKVGLTNNVFEDVFFGFYLDPGVSAFNNTFLFSEFDLWFMASGNPAGGGQWEVRDNIFDACRIGDWGDPWSGHSHNAYVASKFFNWEHFAEEQAATQFQPPGEGDVVPSSVGYQHGPLGRHYLPETASLLTDAGSRTAAEAGLFHQTTRSSQAKDIGQVDIGLHYVSLDTSGNPFDTDGDGKLDVIEDLNGDGKFPSGTGHGETRWNGVPSEPIVRFSGSPLRYYPGAGLVALDPTVIVQDNDETDENFASIERIQVDTTPGDFVRFLPDAELSLPPSGSHPYEFTCGGETVRVLLGGASANQVEIRFETVPVPPQSAIPRSLTLPCVQSLLAKLNYATERTPQEESEHRSVRVTVIDGLGTRFMGARGVKLVSARPAIVVEAGPDMAIRHEDLGQPITLTGRISSSLKRRLRVEWTLVDPVLWEIADIPAPLVPSDPDWRYKCGPCDAGFSLDTSDVLGQRKNPPENPRNLDFNLNAGEERTFNLAKQLPVPVNNRYCVGDCNTFFEAWRYRFRLTATDLEEEGGLVSVMDEVTVRILPPGDVAPKRDELPEVRIRAVNSVRPGQAVQLSADVLNESGQTLSYRWSIDAPFGALPENSGWTFETGGPGPGRYTTPQPAPTVQLAVEGTYPVALCVGDHPAEPARTGCDRSQLVVCQHPASPADIIFAFDTSLMPQGLRDAESAVLALMQSADPGQYRVGVIGFSGSHYHVVEQGLTSDLRKAGAAIMAKAVFDKDVQATPYSQVTPGLVLAANELAAQGRPHAEKIIVLFSDGVVPGFEMSSAMALAATLRKQGIRVVTIAPEAPFFYPELDNGWFVYPEDFYTIIKNPNHADYGAVSSYLLELPEMEDVNDLTGEWQPSYTDVIREGLNRLIRGPLLYAPGNVFQTNVAFSERTRALLDSDPVGYQLMRANRALLTDAYHGQLWQDSPHYYRFMAAMARSPADAFVSGGAEIAAILRRVVSTVCAQTAPLLTVDLGEDRLIETQQRVVLRAVAARIDGGEAGPIVSHQWRAYRMVDGTVPRLQFPDPDGVVAWNVGPNDAEVTTPVFTEPGTYVAQVEIRSASGEVAADSVIIRVTAPAPDGEYDGTRYLTQVVGYSVQIGEYKCPPTGPPSTTTDPPSWLPWVVDGWLCSPHCCGMPCMRIDWTGRSEPGENWRLCPPEYHLRAFPSLRVVSRRNAAGLLVPESCRPAWAPDFTDCLPHHLTNSSASIAALHGGALWDRPIFGLAISPFKNPSWAPLAEPAGAAACEPREPCGTLADWKMIHELDDFLGDAICLDDEPARRMREELREISQTGGRMFARLFTRTYQLPYAGLPWDLTAGEDQNIVATVGNGETVAVQLSGRVTHKTKPRIPFARQWTLDSAPDGVDVAAINNSFDGTQLNTTVVLSAPGAYLFKLSLTELPLNDDCPAATPPRAIEDFLVVNINAANLSAGPDLVVDYSHATQNSPNYWAEATLQGSVADGVPVTWTLLKGPPNMQLAPWLSATTAARPLVQFYTSGSYKFRLAATSGLASDTVWVHVNARPFFAPTAGNEIWTTSTELFTTEGMMLHSQAIDDELPAGQGLRYEWVCVSAPAGAACIFDSPRSAHTWVRFNFDGTAPQDFWIQLTVSDGRLSATTTRSFKIHQAEPPEFVYPAPRDAKGMAIELFPPGTPEFQRYVRVESVQTLGVTRESLPNQVFASSGVATEELAGRILRYSAPPSLALDPCERAWDTYAATFVDRFGNRRSGKLVIALMPPEVSKEEYERTHVFRHVVFAGQPALELPLRALLSPCATLDKTAALEGPWSASLPVGELQLEQASAGAPETLRLTPPATFSGQPVRATVRYRLAGAPGTARFDFLLVPGSLEETVSPGALGGLDPSATIEVNQPLQLSSYQIPRDELDSSGTMLRWTVTRIDGPAPSPVITPEHPRFPGTETDNPCIAILRFPDVGAYLVQLDISLDAGNFAPAGATRVLVVPAGSLATPAVQDPDFGVPEEVNPGPDPDQAPGRASILNLALPGYRPTVCEDGLLTLQAQAAGPTTDDACSFKVLLFPADGGNPVHEDFAAEEARAWNITSAFKAGDPAAALTVDAQGWHQGCRGRNGPNDVDVGIADLSSFTNGNYYVQVWARGVTSNNEPGLIGKSAKHPILLQTARKLGKVQFAETDFSLPAADGRLRVSRNYDSELGRPPGTTQPAPELGWGWSLSSFDLDVWLYESRAGLTEDGVSFWLQGDSEAEQPDEFNVRLAGSRHVTLNLPWNGRRVSFGQATGPDRLPFWLTPDGESGQLTAPEEDRRAYAALWDNPYPKTSYYLSQFGRFEGSFDFSQFILTGPDGAKYYLTRGEPTIVNWTAWETDSFEGKIYPERPALTRVEFADGASLERAFGTGPNNEAWEILKYYPTRPTGGVAPAPYTVTVERGPSGALAGKITKIYSSLPPAGTSDARPAVLYSYYAQGDSDGQGGVLQQNDLRIGNLKSVERLTRTTGEPSDYDKTTYIYESGSAAHLIKKVIGPLNLTSFEAGWLNGRLVWTRDAAGILRSVTYPSVSAGSQLPDQRNYTDEVRTEVPYGNDTVEDFNLDPSAKVTTTTRSDALGHVLETTIDTGANEPILTTRNYFDETRLTSTIDAASRTTAYFYDSFGRLDQTRKPGGIVERFRYNALGQPDAAIDGRNHPTFSVYEDGRLVATEDAKGNRTKTVYFESGEFKGRVNYVEDALGHRTYTRYYQAGDSDLGENPVGSVRETFLLENPADGDYDLTDTSLRRNWTRSKYYGNGLLKSSESTRTGRTGAPPPNDVAGYTVRTEYEYDAQGRITKTVQTPSDNPFTPGVDESAEPDRHATVQVYNAQGKVARSTDKYGRTTEYYYDGRGNLVQTVYPANAGDPMRTVTRTIYDVNNRPIYQQAAHLVAAASLFAASTNFGTHTVYDGLGRVTRTEKLTHITIELEQVMADADPPVAVPDTYHAKLGNGPAPVVLESTTTEYDAIGRVTQVTDAAGSYRKFVYADAVPGAPGTGGSSPTPAVPARKTSYADSDGTEVKVTEEELDANGNVVLSRTFDADSAVSMTTFEYDELNRQTASRVHTLDSAGNVTGVYSETRTTYDALGRRVQSTDADGKATDYGYDGAGRLVKVTEWLVDGPQRTPLTTEYAYDEVGNLTAQKDALGRETKYVYDNFGRRIGRTLPGGQSEAMAYDVSSLTQLLENNALVQRDFRTDFKGQTTRRDYDVRGRLSWKGTGDGTTMLAAFTYTPWGARRTMSDPSGTTTYVYGRLTQDANGAITGTAYDTDRLVIKHHSQLGAITYDYNSRGNVTRIDARRVYSAITDDAPTGTWRATYGSTDTMRALTINGYDSQGRLSSVWRGSGSSMVKAGSYTYQDSGLMTGVTYPEAKNGSDEPARHEFSYAPQKALSSIAVKLGTTTLASFDYDPAGWLLKKSGLRQGLDEVLNGTLTRSVRYTFDSLNRMTKEEVTTDSAGNTGLLDYGTIDAVGNRPRRAVTGNLAGKVLQVDAYSYDANDQVEPDNIGNNTNYDANGNTLLADLDAVGAPDQAQPNQYDLEDRLTQTVRSGSPNTTITLTYDGDGHRVKKMVNGVSTWFLVDDRNPTGYAQVLEERSSENGPPTVIYTYGSDLLCQTRGADTHYYIYDGLGSVRALVSASGQITDTYTYDAYGILIEQRTLSGGQLVPTTAGTANNYLFTGEQWDPDLGMYYLRARYYAPGMGRFWTMDSFEGNSSDPLSLHKYLYCHGDPVNAVDPTGYSETGTLVGTSATQGLFHNTQSIGLGTVATFAHAVRISLAYKIGAYLVLSTMVAGNLALPADAYINAGLSSGEEQRTQIKRLVKLRLEQLEQKNPGQLLYHYTSLERAQNIVRLQYIYPSGAFSDPATGMQFPSGAYATDISPIADYTMGQLANILYFDKAKASGQDLTAVVVILNRRPRGFYYLTTHQYYRKDGEVYALEWLPNPMRP